MSTVARTATMTIAEITAVAAVATLSVVAWAKTRVLLKSGIIHSTCVMVCSSLLNERRSLVSQSFAAGILVRQVLSIYSIGLHNFLSGAIFSESILDRITQMSVFSVSGGWGIERSATQVRGNADFRDFVDSLGTPRILVGDLD